MRRLETTKRFECDLNRAKRRGKDLNKLWQVVERLLEGVQLAPKHRPRSIGHRFESVTRNPAGS